MAYADYRKTKVKRSEEEKLEGNIKFVKHVINKYPELCLRSFETFRNTGRNRKGLDSLGIFNEDDLRNYINGIEA